MMALRAVRIPGLILGGKPVLGARAASAAPRHHPLGKSDGGVEGGADLVADLGEEVGLVGARRFGGTPRLDELALGKLERRDVAQDGAERALGAVADVP